MATVASVYAKAVFELARERGELDSVLEQMKGFAETMRGHGTLAAVLSGPSIDPKSRKAVLDDILKALGATGTVKNLLDLLARKGRLGYAPQIADELGALVEAAQGILPGKVRSAVELSADELNVLAAALAKRVGKRVRLTQSVDPALLGGVVATVAGKTFDASLRTQLDRFKNELI